MVYRKIAIKIEDPKEKNEFQEIFNKYIVLLKEREQAIQKILAREENLKSRVDDLVEEKKLCANRIDQLDQESMKLKSDVEVFASKEKDLEYQNDYRTAQLELELHKQGEEDFKEFLKKNEEIFKGVKRTYGNKIVEKIKMEHKKEITELAITQHADRKNMVKNVYKSIHHINEIVKTNETTEKLIPHIESAKEIFDQQESVVTNLNSQLAGIIELENEAVVQIEAFLQRKKSELDHFLEVFYRKRNYEFTFQRLAEIKAQLEKKKQRIANLNNKIEALRKKREEERTAHAIQSIQQRIKLEAAQKQLEEIQKVLKLQVVVLGKQAKNCNLLIESDKRRVEILNDKLSTSITNLKLTKQILGQKFRGLDDIALPDTINPEELNEEERKESMQIHFDKNAENNPALSNYRETNDVLITENAGMEDQKYGSIGGNVMEYNEHNSDEEGSDFDLDNLRAEVMKTEHKKTEEVHAEVKEEDEPGRFIYSGFNEKKSKFKIDILSCPDEERKLFDGTKTLFEGMSLYKKYTTKTLLIEKRAFDPLQSFKFPPDACGFGKRLITYNPTTHKVEFRLVDDPRVCELSIPLSKILNILIPTETVKIIKAQQNFGTIPKGNFDDENIVFEKVDRQLENEAYREKCRKVIYYPYSLITEDKRIEIIAETYTIYKYSIQAINQLIKSQALLKKLKTHLIREALPEDEDLESEEMASIPPDIKVNENA